MPDEQASTRTDSVLCPRCGAEPGKPCETPSGVKRSVVHVVRYNTWVRAVLAQERSWRGG